MKICVHVYFSLLQYFYYACVFPLFIRILEIMCVKYSCMDKSWVDVVPCYLGPAVIKLFESENELKCKNRLRDFIETLCLFSNIWENSLRLFAISDSRYNYLAKFLLFSRKSYDKFLENILKFYDGGPGSFLLIVSAETMRAFPWNHARQTVLQAFIWLIPVTYPCMPPLLFFFSFAPPTLATTWKSCTLLITLTLNNNYIKIIYKIMWYARTFKTSSW